MLLEYADNIQNGIAAFGLMLSKIVASAGNPALGAGVKTFTGVILKMTASKKNMWMNIQDNLRTQIDDKITHNHFGTLVHLVQKLQEYMKVGPGLTKKDLDVHIMTMKTQFLPQTFAYTSFNSKWTTALPAFLTYMTAAHRQLIQEGKIDQCTLAKELQIIREETIQAAKALARARYKGFIGMKEFKKKVDDCKGALCYQASWLSFKDTATGQTYSQPISAVYGLIVDLQDHTYGVIWDQLVSKVNMFFDSTHAPCPKEYPQPIKRPEIEFEYSYKCFGRTDDKECSLPCYAYGSGYNWCPTRIPKNNLLFNYWGYCKKDTNLLNCMPVKGTTIFE